MLIEGFDRLWMPPCTPPGSASAPSASRSRSSTAGADEYPEHDHSADGIGGQMFAKRPVQLGQEEVYIALRGSGTLGGQDGEEYPIDPDHIVRVGTGGQAQDPRRSRMASALLALGATPGEAYDSGGTL